MFKVVWQTKSICLGLYICIGRAFRKYVYILYVIHQCKIIITCKVSFERHSFGKYATKRVIGIIQKLWTVTLKPNLRYLKCVKTRSLAGKWFSESRIKSNAINLSYFFQWADKVSEPWSFRCGNQCLVNIYMHSRFEVELQLYLNKMNGWLYVRVVGY